MKKILPAVAGLSCCLVIFSCTAERKSQAISSSNTQSTPHSSAPSAEQHIQYYALSSDSLAYAPEWYRDSYSQVPLDNNRFDVVEDAEFISVSSDPLSTFSSDVDTASYSIVRSYLNGSQLPPADAIRLEEMINYPKYEYAQPTDKHPISIDTEVTVCPWNPDHRLARIALQGEMIDTRDRPQANLVFLIDSSGSMNSSAKLGLLKKSLKSLVKTLNPNDRISIVTYAGSSRLVLDSTPVSNQSEILSALKKINSRGSTNGEGGILQAYAVAEKHFIEDGVNRVILCTDGDFNVGVSHDGGLVELVEEKAESNVFLSVLGFGHGNLNDSMMEKISNHGNGNYSYIDTEKEGVRVLVDNASATLMTIAKDVKIQVEFNPEQVAAYKLIGYENRALEDHEFNDDQKDAGEIGAGHQVTALYEIVPAGKALPEDLAEQDPLRYQSKGDGEIPSAENSDEMLFVKVRYKMPDEDESILITQTVIDEGKSLTQISDNTLLSASIACFGMMMRNEETATGMSSKEIENLIKSLQDSSTDREFVDELKGMIQSWDKLQTSS